MTLTKFPDDWGESRFTRVWRWEGWRRELARRGEPDPGIDIGIDLVGEQTNQFGGGLCAIHCRSYSHNGVSTREVDEFLAASANVNAWSHRIFVVTTDLAPTALKKLNEAGNVTLLTLNELDTSPVGAMGAIMKREPDGQRTIAGVPPRAAVGWLFAGLGVGVLLMLVVPWLAAIVIASVFLLAGVALVCWLAENKTFNRWSRKATKGLRR